MRKVPSLETIVHDYEPKGVRFYYVYKALAHPELNDYVRPYTLEERLMHVAEARRRLGSGIPWLADTMNNDLVNALGRAPNGEWLIDPDGKVLARRLWSDPDTLRSDLAAHLGEVSPATQVADVELAIEPYVPTEVARGVMPRIDVLPGVKALRIEPAFAQTHLPFYAKLRAEADGGFWEEDEGKLYIGFHLDPLYETHWNNEAKPLSFEITAPDGVEVTPASVTASVPSVKADADPREFLLDLRGTAEAPLQVDVHYYACDNADTFCIPVRQSYAVHLEKDQNGGAVMSRVEFFRGRGAGVLEKMKSYDSDGDGQLTRDEMPETHRHRFGAWDVNQDAVLDEEEIRLIGDRRRG